MNKNLLLFAGIALLALGSCKNEEPEKPKVIYEKTTKPRATADVDTAKIEIADLPVHIPGTDYLIHPIGDFRTTEGKNRSNGYDKGSFTISNFNEFEITGFLHNLRFQQINSDSLQTLTDKTVLIQTATFLKTVADRTKQQVMVYTLADMDTNRDGRLDVNDIRTLYISELGGKRLTKVSEDYRELVDWYLVDATSRLYFRTIEDTNKNGEFDRNDVLHYNYIDLSNKEWKVVPYSPV
jgi:hypothetical protein